MKSLLLAAALTMGACYVENPGGTIPEDYLVCEDAAAPTPICEQYYVWSPPVFVGGVWGNWHYDIRPRWRRPYPGPWHRYYGARPIYPGPRGHWRR